MGRKNNRCQTEYRRGFGFDPKKYITPKAERTPQRGDVWFADLGDHPDTSVQSGCRPVIVISNNIGNSHSDTLNILPMTRHMKKPELPCHAALDPDRISDAQQMLDTSMILAEQITTIGKYALKNYVGHINDSQLLNAINTAVAVQLGLSDERSAAKCL